MAGIVVNGEQRPLEGVPLHTNALDFLRACGLTGAKEGCAEGECGACSVLVARPAADGSDATEWTAINSCLVPAASLDGQEVVTAEGLGAPDALHPVQHEMAVRGGSQCGYCTPGFVCSMAAEFYRAGRKATNGAGPETQDAYHGDNGFDLHALSGNLCRCTGYRPIMDAAYALGFPAADDALARRRTAAPPAAVPTRLHDAEARFVRPTDLQQALRILAEEPDATVVAGSTDFGVDVNLKGARASLVVAVDRLEELRGFVTGASAPSSTSDGGEELRIGAALTLSEIERRLDGRLPLLAALFPQFASRLIRNGATLGGNLGTGSPIGDAPPVLLALEASRGARVHRRGADGAARRLLHRLPRVGASPRRADHRGRRADARQHHHGVPQDRQAALRRHLVGGGGVRDRGGRRAGAQGAHRARRRRRHADPGAGHRGGAGGPALGRRDGRGGSAGAVRGRYADRRPAGQREVQGGDAGQLVAEAVRGRDGASAPHEQAERTPRRTPSSA